MKLQRYISEAAGIARRKAIKLIEDGQVKVNSQTVLTPYTLIDPEHDRITLEGKSLKLRATPDIVLILNKPPGYLVSDDDDQDRPLAKYLFQKKIRVRLFPVGRLDFNSQGLMIYTNNGDLAQRLSHPRNQIERSYRVKIQGIPLDSHQQKMRQGLYVAGLGRFPGCSVQIERKTGKNCWLLITILQGRNREVRKLFEHFHYQVVKLVRTNFGPFSVKGIPLGHYVLLSNDKIKELQHYLEYKGQESQPASVKPKRTGHRKKVSRP
ncbi:rRNA pseudouridine synthase [bacterium]|nr:rRNA pseudouridine synthase [bacterium]